MQYQWGNWSWHPFQVPIHVLFSFLSFLQKMFHWSLISRRSRFQTGSRFFSRGCDPKGNVSNFCETEQIVEYNGQLASYVQTRGSMPFYWSQRPCVKYMPKPIVTGSNEQNRTAMSAHFHEQIDLYGELVLVNLINQKTYEGMLEQTFRDLVAKVALQGVNYEAFDFHKECSKMRYDRLSLLSEQLSNYKFGYFLKTRESVLQKQVNAWLRYHTVRNLHFLSKNSTLISREKLSKKFGVKNSWKCCGFGLFSCWQLWFHEKNCQKKFWVKNSWKCWRFALFSCWELWFPEKNCKILSKLNVGQTILLFE